MVLVIDNYDSFTFNIVHMVETLGYRVTCVRNDDVTLTDIAKMKPSHIIISPGPGRPEDAGISVKVVKRFGGKIPILGVCLGHQCIVQAYGGTIIGAPRIVHGKTSVIMHDNRGIFRNLPQSIDVVRYHSLCADANAIPSCLEITAETADDKTIMGVCHRSYQTVGVQFHPESIGTLTGRRIMENFFHYKKEEPQKLVLLNKVMTGKDLTAEESYIIMDEITDGEFTESQLGAFLGALTAKGVSSTELSSFVRVLRDKAGVKKRIAGALDTCGTGGDGRHTFNISTAAALVCSALGIYVAKHGNRAITSKSGSFDFLNALGIPTQGDLDANIASLRKNHFAFFFAPKFHSAMRHVAKGRQEIKTRTVFNMIGPLANPLAIDYQLVGVFDPSLLDLFIASMKKLGRRRAMAVHSMDGLDEISISSKTLVRELKNGQILSYEIDPAAFGIKGFTLKDIQGSSANDNVQSFLDMIGRKTLTRRLSAIKAAVCLNAGAAIYIAGKAKTIVEGYHLAVKMVESKQFLKYIQALAG